MWSLELPEMKAEVVVFALRLFLFFCVFSTIFIGAVSVLSETTGLALAYPGSRHHFEILPGSLCPSFLVKCQESYQEHKAFVLCRSA